MKGKLLVYYIILLAIIVLTFITHNPFLQLFLMVNVIVWEILIVRKSLFIDYPNKQVLIFNIIIGSAFITIICSWFTYIGHNPTPIIMSMGMYLAGGIMGYCNLFKDE